MECKRRRSFNARVRIVVEGCQNRKVLLDASLRCGVARTSARGCRADGVARLRAAGISSEAPFDTLAMKISAELLSTGGWRYAGIARHPPVKLTTSIRFLQI